MLCVENLLLVRLGVFFSYTKARILKLRANFCIRGISVAKNVVANLKEVIVESLRAIIIVFRYVVPQAKLLISSITKSCS